MISKEKNWLKSIEKKSNIYIFYPQYKGYFENFEQEEKEQILLDLKDKNKIEIYGLEKNASNTLRAYINSSSKKSYQILKQEILERFEGSEEKKVIANFLNQGVLEVLQSAHHAFLDNVIDKRIEKIELSLGDIRNFSYQFLENIYQDKIAYKLQQRAHQKGFCLEGEIPDDLVLFQTLNINIPTLIEIQHRYGYFTLSDFTTSVTSQEEAIKKLTNVARIGRIQASRIVEEIEERGFSFGSREEKLLQYKAQINGAVSKLSD